MALSTKRKKKIRRLWKKIIALQKQIRKLEGLPEAGGVGGGDPRIEW